MANPLRAIHLYADAKLRGLGTRPAGLGAVALTPTGHTILEANAYHPSATSPEAELLAIKLGLTRIAGDVRNAHARSVACYTDSQTAWSYLHRGRSSKPHLALVRNQIQSLERRFASVGYHKVPRDVTAIRRCETLARHALRRHGHRVAHRGSKGKSSGSGKPYMNPYAEKE